MKTRKLILVLALTALAVLLLAACSPVMPAPNGTEGGPAVSTPVNGDDGEGAIAGADAKTIEILSGLAVVTGVLRKGGLILLNLALVSFFIAIGIAKSRGLSIQCGCFGGQDSPSSYLELFLRDGVLLLMGMGLTWLCRLQPDRASP